MTPPPDNDEVQGDGHDEDEMMRTTPLLPFAYNMQMWTDGEGNTPTK